MKKAITLALVAAMLTATGITAFAAPITANSNPKTGGTTVNYQVAPVYTVVIPDTVTLGNTKVTEQIKIYGADENSNVVIGKKQKVNVALTASANGFNVKTADGDTVAYTVNDKNAVDNLTTVAECTAAEGKKNTDITFTKTGTAAYAGTYTDTLTFTVSLTNPVVSHSLGADYLVNGCTATVRCPDYFSNNGNAPASITFTNNNGTFELVSYGGTMVENAIVEQTADNKLKLIFQHIFNGRVSGQTTLTFDLDGMTYSVNDSGYYEIEAADSFVVDGTEIISELTKA